MRGRVAGPVHNPPPFASWAWVQAMAELHGIVYLVNIIVHNTFNLNFIVIQFLDSWRHGGLMVSALDISSSGPGSNPQGFQ